MNSLLITEIGYTHSESDINDFLLHQEGQIVIDYEMVNIGNTQSYLDILHDYIEASYIAEYLGSVCTEFEYQEVHKPPNAVTSRFFLTTHNTALLAARIYQLSIALSGDEKHEEAYFELVETLDDYVDGLAERTFICPYLVDGYYANLVNGGYYEIDSESESDYLEEEYKKYPERRFGFWKSAYSNTIGNTFYTSSDGWIVPSNVDYSDLLKRYSGLSSVDAHEEAQLFAVGGYSYLLHEHSLVYFPFGPFLNAKRLMEYFSKEDNFANNRLEMEVLTYLPDYDYVEERYGVDVRGTTKYYLSVSASYLVVIDNDVKYVFFPREVQARKTLALYEIMSGIFAKLSVFAGVSRSISLAWDTLDDEVFESLCYDIIYHHPRYDNSTLRKMGKSRSRDGGRDLVVFTKDRVGQPRKKFIFQCKFTIVGTSLTTSKVTGISDTIFQFGAQGYGLMTSVVIDSALYDRVDEICERFSIESNHWSVFEIERFMARHPTLKERYFK